MAMKLVKKTDNYSIFKRNDDRYAVQDANRNAINGEEKTRILVEEELIKLTAAAAPAEEPAAEEPAADDAETEAEAEAEAEAPAEDDK